MFPLDPTAQSSINSVFNDFPAAVPVFGSGVVSLSSDMGQSHAMNSLVGMAQCGGEGGVAVAGHGGLGTGYCKINHQVTSVNSPVSSTSVGVGCHGPVAQLSSSHTSSSPSSNHGTQ